MGGERGCFWRAWLHALPALGGPRTPLLAAPPSTGVALPPGEGCARAALLRVKQILAALATHASHLSLARGLHRATDALFVFCIHVH
jgi:hypothetical protein